MVAKSIGIAFFDTVPLGDFRIRLYRNADDNDGTFYYAPMALLDHTSATCHSGSRLNPLTGQPNEMSFAVQMWNEEIQDVVSAYLNVTSVSVIPFDRVFIRCAQCPLSGVRLSGGQHWFSFAHSPQRMDFRLTFPTAAQCQETARQMARNPEQFSNQFELHFLLDDAKRKSEILESMARLYSTLFSLFLDNWPF